MRISLTQTILLSTALLTMNFPLSAMEDGVNGKDGANKVSTTAAAKEQTDPSLQEPTANIIIPVNSPYQEKAEKLARSFFNDEEEVKASLTIFCLIAELLDNKDAGTSLLSSDNSSVSTIVSLNVLNNSTVREAGTTESLVLSNQLSTDTQSFISGNLLLIAEHHNHRHPDFNEIYTVLADDFLSTTLPNNAQGKVSGTQETTERLTKIHMFFKGLIDQTNSKIQEHTSSLATADTPTTESAAQVLIQEYKAQNNELKERLFNLLEHFSNTRNFIIQTDKTIYSKMKVIKNTASPDLSFKSIGEKTSTISKNLESDISYLKKLKRDSETLLHTLYDYDRTDRDLSATPNLFAKGVVLFQAALTSAAGNILNLTEGRKLRYERTGYSTLPLTISISSTFVSEKCEGATDQATHERYIEYIKSMIKPTPALFDAIKAKRIKFVGQITPETENKTISSANICSSTANSKLLDEANGEKSEEKDEIDAPSDALDTPPNVKEDLNAASFSEAGSDVDWSAEQAGIVTIRQEFPGNNYQIDSCDVDPIELASIDELYRIKPNFKSFDLIKK
ncbi:MAG: hypothetical protein V4544_03095 [Pseudomonadota bacterium]